MFQIIADLCGDPLSGSNYLNICSKCSRLMVVAFVSLFVLAATASSAFAGDRKAASSGFYFAGKGGPTFGLATEIENGAGRPLQDDEAISMIGSFGMGLGYTWAKHGLPLRTEVELINRTEISYNASPLFSGSIANDAIGSDIQNVTAMAKGYYHLDSGGPMWSPFLSAGLGLSRNAVSGQYTPAGGKPADLDEVTYDLAWTVGAGASLYLGNHFVNDVELSYVDLGDVEWGRPAMSNLKTGNLGSVQLTFAIRYNF